jgi:DNA-binding NarL/FixJ family response regulator
MYGKRYSKWIMGLKGESHPRSKLTSKEVIQIRELYSKGFSSNVIARNFKVSTWNIEEIVKRKTWTHI